MVLKRSKGYEDIDGQTAAAQNDVAPTESGPPQEIEMASVSVVPDGKWGFESVLDETC